MYEYPPGPWSILFATFDDWLESLGKVSPSSLRTIERDLPLLNMRLKELIAAQEIDDDDADGDFEGDLSVSKEAMSVDPTPESYVLSPVSVSTSHLYDRFR